MVIRFHELRGSATQFQDGRQATSRGQRFGRPRLEFSDCLCKSSGVTGAIRCPDAGLDGAIKVFQPLAAVTNLDEGV